MLLEEFDSAISAKSHQDLIKQAVKFTHRLEFETVTIMAALDRVGQETLFCAVDNISDPGATAMQDDTERNRQDPVMQHCKMSHLPIVWDRRTYEKAGKLLHWDAQAAYGFCTGIAVASHLPNGRHLLIGVDRGGDLPSDVERVTSLVAQLQLFIACAVDASLHILLDDAMPRRESLPALSPRELEAMRWTMEGKTAWEVGQILGITEQTAARHLNNATQKLGCTNKIQAVVKAIRAGIIS
jgi:DNA-binding CsgD family transcriptional regulator